MTLTRQPEQPPPPRRWILIRALWDALQPALWILSCVDLVVKACHVVAWVMSQSETSPAIIVITRLVVQLYLLLT